MTMIKLKVSGGLIVEVESVVARESLVVNRAMEDGLEEQVIPVPNVRAETLFTIMTYCRKHSIEKPENKDELDKWDDEFLDNIGAPMLAEVVMGANYLEVDGLRDKIIDKVAFMITGKSPEAIREMLDIENDLSPEEEKAIRDKYPWAFQYRKVEDVLSQDGAPVSFSSVGASSSLST